MKLYGYRNVLNGKEIIDHFLQQGIEDLHNPLSLHVTIIYSNNDVDEHLIELDNKIITLNSQYTMDVFDKFLVMKIDSTFLQKRFSYFKSKGCSWDFETYNPHITISDTFTDITKIKPYSGKIILGYEKIEKLCREWSEEDNIKDTL